MTYIQQQHIVSRAVLGDELLLNGGLESWTDTSTLDDWLFVALGTGGAITQENTEVYAGTSSAKLTTCDDGSPSYISQYIDTLSSGDYVFFSGAGKIGDCTAISVFGLDGTTLANSTKEYDLDTNTWVDISGSPANPILISDGDWTEKNFVIPVPTSGIVNIVMIATGSGANKYGYVDAISLKEYNREEIQDTQNQIFCKYAFKDIDLKQPGLKILKKIPTGQEFIPLSYYVEIQEAASIDVTGEFSIGCNGPDFDNIIPTHTTLPTAIHTVMKLSEAEDDTLYLPQSEDFLVLNVTTPYESDDDIYVTIHLIGTLTKGSGSIGNSFVG